ncbi:MAG: hypothetical protein K0U34_01835, partial [Alphaproteobacteria bacterium]|nr:hypothetical protein [Alphaproteobacteria bacterium]
MLNCVSNLALNLRTFAVVLIAGISFHQAQAQEAEQVPEASPATEVEESLPEVEIIADAPSPVKKKPKKKRSGAAQAPTPAVSSGAAQSQADFEPVEEFDVGTEQGDADLRGRLPVAKDTFVPVTIVDDEEILAGHGAN